MKFPKFYSSNLPESKRHQISISKKAKKTFSLVIGLVVFLLIVSALRSNKKGNRIRDGGQVASSEKTSSPEDVVEINKTFEFKAVNQDKEEIPVSFTIIVSERKDEIRLKGESRKPPSDKDYLLIRAEIQNDKTQRVALATADRIRLEIEGKLFAPDYHNGNVVVDPISVRRDLLAFVVDKDAKKFVLQIGELEGEKQKLEINFD